MHALTRPMSETYCWQSRIASGSHAARCCGVHCCAAAGQDATVSARPSSTAAAAFIGPSFCWALRISIFALHLVSDLVSTIHSTTMGQRRQLSLVTGALDEGSALATQRCATGSLRFQGSNVCHLSASLIGRLGSSAFRLSGYPPTPVSMSLTGSRFSSDSAPRPFHHGIRRRGGTIFRATLPSM